MSSPRVASARATSRDLPPLTYKLPEWEPAAHTPRRSKAQLLAGAAMFAGAGWLAFQDTTFRHFEAWLATPITGFITGRHGATTSHDLVYFALGTRRAFGLQITQECTSALLLIPLLVMMGFFTLFSRLSLRRELLAVTIGAALMLIVNIARVAGIAWATWRFGYNPGYTISHVFVGSALSLIGFVGAMLLALWILVRGNRARTATVADDAADRCEAILLRITVALDAVHAALLEVSSRPRLIPPEQVPAFRELLPHLQRLGSVLDEAEALLRLATSETETLYRELLRLRRADARELTAACLSLDSDGFIRAERLHLAADETREALVSALNRAREETSVANDSSVELESTDLIPLDR